VAVDSWEVEVGASRIVTGDRMVTLEHFIRAAADVAAHGDNDALPFDVDTRFIADNQKEVAAICDAFFKELQSDTVGSCSRKITDLPVFAERLLAPSGPSGFRVVSKIHPFWNVYLNGLCVAIAERLEPVRSPSVYSYRFVPGHGKEIFDRDRSWRRFREETMHLVGGSPNSVVVQTDISSFYERVSHHYIENAVDDLFPDEPRIGDQINKLLGKFSAGRSFGLPIGGQGARIIAELFLKDVDRRASAEGVRWFRYVDDYVIIASNHSEAYQALARLSHILADFGLSLNRTKTTILSSRHYAEYVEAQLGSGDEAGALREIDLHFDPYSDSPDEDYESLKDAVGALHVQQLLNRELDKAVPDGFLVSQIGRTLRLHDQSTSFDLVSTLLREGNLHAFRASWSTIMRGVSALRSDTRFSDISSSVDALLDDIPNHSPHLLVAESNQLHYLRAIRFSATAPRETFVQKLYKETTSDTVRRYCIDCWRIWRDRSGFNFVRNRWNELSAECQRMVWLSAGVFGDQGEGLKRQLRGVEGLWRLGIERQGHQGFGSLYRDWADAALPDL
jgi:hypothetical protein